MKFISYAQNFEDVILWRALGHIERGSYIDIGAAWPIQHSVTKAFYDSGWRGINVEPNPDFFELYAEERPEDINLQLAVSDNVGEEIMNFISDTGLSTMSNEVTQVHSFQGYTPEPKKVNVTTLNCIFQKYVMDNRDIHFLKIDVEGLEPQVIKGCNWLVNRPWVVIVEATVPLSQELNHLEWESALTDAQYNFVYMDGLNRFYIANEHLELATAFSNPPNCFDDFILYSESLKSSEIEQLTYTNRELEKRINSHQEDYEKIDEINSELLGLRKELKLSQKNEKLLFKSIEQYKHEAWSLRHEIALIHQSKFWRIGSPLRISIKYTGKLFRFIKFFNKKESPKALIRFCLIELGRFPKIKALLKKIVNRSGLQNIIAKLVYDSIKPPVIHQASSLSKKAELIKRKIEVFKAGTKSIKRDK